MTVRPLTAPGAGGGTVELAIEPSRGSRTDSAAYRLLADALRQSWRAPDLVVAPWLCTAATDARHFEGLAEDVYRFTGVTIGPEDVARFHGTDERITVEDYGRVIEVYYRVLRGLDRLDG